MYANKETGKQNIRLHYATLNYITLYCSSCTLRNDIALL